MTFDKIQLQAGQSQSLVPTASKIPWWMKRTVFPLIYIIFFFFKCFNSWYTLIFVTTFIIGDRASDVDFSGRQNGRQLIFQCCCTLSCLYETTLRSFFQHFKSLGNVPTKLFKTCKQMIVLFTRSQFFFKSPWKSLAMSTDHMNLWYNLGSAFLFIWPLNRVW